MQDRRFRIAARNQSPPSPTSSPSCAALCAGREKPVPDDAFACSIANRSAGSRNSQSADPDPYATQCGCDRNQ